MSKEAKISARIVLDGEKQFKESVTSCNKRIKTMRSELTLAKETYAENANSLEALEAKHRIYSQILQEQKNKVTETAKGHDHAVEVYNKAGSQLDELKNKEEAARQKLEKMRKETQVSAEKIEEQEKVVKDLAAAVSDGERKYQMAGNRLQKWKNDLNTANAQVIKADRELRKNKQYMKEAEDATDHCARSIDQFGKKVNEASKEIQDMHQDSKDAFSTLASTVAAGEVVQKVEQVAESLYDCAEAAETFQTASRKVSTIADTSKVSMDALNEEILKVSSETGKAAGNIAEATYEAISAGTNTEDAVNMVGNANKLAVAGFTEETTAIDVLTTSINAYKLSADQAARISDVLIMTQNKGKITVGELGSNIGKVIPIAAAYNTDIENLGASYAKLTASGIKAEESTTYIKSMLNELGDTGSKVSQILSKKTGKSFAELMKDGNSLGDVIGILGESVDGNKTKFNNLWSSSEAGVGALTLLNAGTEEFNSTLKDMQNSTGTTEDAFQKMSETTEMSKQKMVNALNNLKIAIGNELNKSLDGMYEKGQSAFEWASDFVQEHPGVVKGITAIAIGIGALSVGFAGYAAITNIAAVATEAYNAALASNPAGLVAIAITSLVAAIGTFVAMNIKAKNAENENMKSTKEYIDTLDERNEAIKQSVQTSKENKETAEEDIYATKQQIERLKELNQVKNKTAQQKNEMKTIVDSLSSQIPEISNAYDEQTGKLQLTNKQLEKMVKNYEQLYLTQAAEDDLKELYKSRYDAEKNVNSANQELEKSQQRVIASSKKAQEAQAALNKEYEENKNNVHYNENNSDVYHEAIRAEKEYLKVKDQEEKLQNDLNEKVVEYKKTLWDCDDQIDSTTEYIKNLGKETSDTGDEMEKGGKSAAKGMADGIKKGKGEIKSAAKDVASSAKDAYDQELDIKNGASGKLKLSGERMVDGIINGIQSKKSSLNKTASELGQDLISKLEDKIEMKNLETNGKGYSLSQIEKYWKGVEKSTKKGTKAYKEAYKRYLEARNERINAEKEARKEAAEKAKEAAEEAKEKAEQADNDKVSSTQDKIDTHELKTGKSYDLKTIRDYWKDVIKETRKGTDAYKDAQKNFYSVRNEMKKQRNDARKALKKQSKDLLKDLKSEMQELQKNYEEAVKSTRENILSSLNLFDNPEVKRTSNANGLLRNLKNQVELIQKWSANLQTLRNRGLSEDLMNELQGMGISSAGDVETLAGMSDEQLQQYQEYYNQKNALAQQEAENQNATMLESNKKQIDAIKKQTKKQLTDLRETYRQQMKNLGFHAAKGFAKGIQSGNKEILKAIADMTGSTVKQVKKSLGIHSPSKVFEEMGGYTGMGFANGLSKETQNLSDILIGHLPEKVSAPISAVDTKNAGVSSLKEEPLSLKIYIDSKVLGEAVYDTVNLKQGVNARLVQRGMIVNG